MSAKNLILSCFATVCVESWEKPTRTRSIAIQQSAAAFPSQENGRSRFPRRRPHATRNPSSRAVDRLVKVRSRLSLKTVRAERNPFGTYIREYVFASWSPKRFLVKEEVRGRERDLPRPLRERLLLGDPILRQSTLVLLGVTAHVLSLAAPERSRLLRHALPSLPYLRCNLFPGINAPRDIPRRLSRGASPASETYRGAPSCAPTMSVSCGSKAWCRVVDSSRGGTGQERDRVFSLARVKFVC